MAIVADLSGVNQTDKSYFTHSRSMAGTPNGVLTPAFVGEIVLDTTNHVRWIAVTLLTSGWIAQEAEVT